MSIDRMRDSGSRRGLASIGLLCSLVMLLAACGRTRATEAQPAQTVPSAIAAPQAKRDAPAPSVPARAGGLSWTDAPPFVRREPKSSMRAAEYGVSGDPHAELAVFYFGPDQGGSIDANVTRWLGQFRQPDGSDTKERAKRQIRDIAGTSVTFLEATGAYSGGMAMPGAPPPEPQTDAMLLGAIAAGPGGPVFFKLVGPRETVERSRAGFEQLLGSLHK